VPASPERIYWLKASGFKPVADSLKSNKRSIRNTRKKMKIYVQRESNSAVTLAGV
jgi:hypothetical protein